MRISDWSSDVCSSDLRIIVITCVEFPLGTRQLGLKFGEFIELFVEQGGVREFLTQACLKRRKTALIGFKASPDGVSINIEIENGRVDPPDYRARSRLVGDRKSVV